MRYRHPALAALRHAKAPSSSATDGAIPAMRKRRRERTSPLPSHDPPLSIVWTSRRPIQASRPERFWVAGSPTLPSVGSPPFGGGGGGVEPPLVLRFQSAGGPGWRPA